MLDVGGSSPSGRTKLGKTMDIDDICYPIRHENRIKSKSAPLIKRWCDICDAQLVGVGSRCSNCGGRTETERLKNFEIKD